MRVTAKEWAARHGLADRTVQAKLQRGTLRGTKERDPVTDVELWYVDEFDESEDRSTGVPERPERPEPRNSDSPAHPEHPPTAGLGEVVALLREKDQAIAQLHRENVELAGRCGFYQSEIQHLQSRLRTVEARVLELETPREVTGQLADHPAPSGSAADSGSQKVSPRAWWQFWRWYHPDNPGS
jgi:hypothetical protein